MNSKIFTSEFVPYAYNTKFSLHSKDYDLDCKDIVVMDDYLNKLETNMSRQLDFVKTLKEEIKQANCFTIIKIDNYNFMIGDIVSSTKSILNMMLCHLTALYFCKNKQLVIDLITEYNSVVEICNSMGVGDKTKHFTLTKFDLDLETVPGHFQNAIEKIKAGVINIYAGDYSYKDLRNL